MPSSLRRRRRNLIASLVFTFTVMQRKGVLYFGVYRPTERAAICLIRVNRMLFTSLQSVN